MKKLINFLFHSAVFIFGLFVAYNMIILRPYLEENLNDIREIAIEEEVYFVDDYLAMVVHETNWLKSNVYVHYNNPNGMHCAHVRNTHYEDDLCLCSGGNRKEADGSFCQYKTVRDGIRHFKRWQDRRWKNSFASRGTVPQNSEEFLAFLRCFPMSDSDKGCTSYAADPRYIEKVRMSKKMLNNLKTMPFLW